MFFRAMCIVALITNSALFILIVSKSPTNYGNYKHLLAFIAVFEMVNAIIDALSDPQFFTNGSSYFIVLSSRESVIPVKFLWIFSLLYCTAFGTSLAIFAAHFLFRYLVVSRGRKSTEIPTTVWMVCSLIFGLVWTFVCGFFLGPSIENGRYLNETFLKPLEIDLYQVSYIGLYFYPENSGFNILNVAGTFLITILVLINSYIMIYYGWKCYAAIKNLTKVSSCSSRYRSLQQQLFTALVLQTAIPLLLMHIPSCGATFSCFFDASIPIIGQVLSKTIVMFPAVDPLPNMLIIMDYRRALLNFFSCRKKQIGSQCVHHHSSVSVIAIRD